jgi:photosystem II stability/assembly factor-like uncharacterized protein
LKTWIALLALAAPLPAQNLKEALAAIPARNIGPANPGGRIDDIAVVESDPRIMYVGTAAGGIFKTTNGGVTFTPLTDKLPVSTIGDIAIAPSDPSILYVGMGEANNRQSSSWGNGVYKSMDAGKTWTHLGLADSHHIGRIVVHPTNPDIVYVAAGGHLWGPNKERGVYKSIDGGKTWQSVLFLNEDTGASDIAIDPASPSTLYAAMYQRRRTPWGFNGGGPHSGLYKTIDGGATWARLKNGLPEGGETGRIGIDIYRRDSNIVYVCYEHAKGGVFRSDNKGETWTKMGDYNPRPMYFSQIRIDPNNDQRIWLAGVNLAFSEDGAKTFNQNVSQTIHADFHAIWIDPKNSDHVVTGCDGGVNITWDRAKTWDYVNTITISQYYEVAYDMKRPYNVCGGLQDNGSWCGPSATRHEQGITNEDWYKVYGADGFYAGYDNEDNDIVFAEGQDGNLQRRNLKTGEVRAIRPEPKEGEEHYRFQWNSPLLVSRHASKTIYYGGNYLFKSTDRGETWRKLGPDLTNHADRNKIPVMGRTPDREMRSPNDGVSAWGTLTVITESPKSPAVLWAGTDDGNLQVTRNGGEIWKNVAANVPGLPKETYVSRIVTSESGDGVAYAAFDGHRGNDYTPFLYSTTDYGQTWQSIGGGLPKTAGTVHAIREDPRNPNVLFAGTEFGLFVSIDKGAHWTRFESNFPTVPVFDIAIHPRDRDLIVATHGRGIWIVDDITPIEELSSAIMAEPLHVFTPRTATEWRLFDHKGVNGNKLYVAPNPPYGAILQFYLAESLAAKDEVKIEVVDKSGTVVRKLTGPKSAGIQRVAWDLRYPPPFEPPAAASGLFFLGAVRGPMVSPGRYTVRVTAAGKTVQGSVEVDEDPRVTLPAPDREERLKMQLTISQLQSRSDVVRRGVTSLRTRLIAMQDSWSKPDAPKVSDAARQSATSLRERLDTISRRLALAMRFEADDPPGLEYRPPSLAQRLLRLGSSLDNYTTKPTSTQLEELSVLTQQVAEIEGTWKKVSEDDVTALNRTLSAAGVSYLAAGVGN